ncbi:MAG: LysR family transcriptional regulator, partial [Pseudomonadota bacterium]|nr:LysR family transcriptional regulator [Pseudomonadota bacterium]
MLHRLEFLDLQAFIQVAELGSFHEAAQRLHLSQPALSRRIQKLEELLEVSLLERTTRRTRLTAIGADFLPRARRMIEEYESSILGIRELATHQTGTVTIACLPTAAFYFLPSVIREFSEAWPGIRIRILDVSANEGLEKVISGEADFGINM